MGCKKCKECNVSCLMRENSENPFPYLTPELCDARCKKECFFNIHFAEHEIEKGIENFNSLVKYPEHRQIKKEIFIIGTGIASLTTIHHLLKNGISPVVISNISKYGGLLTNCIPQFRIKNIELFKKHTLAIMNNCSIIANNNLDFMSNIDFKDSIIVYCRGNYNERKLYQNSITGIKFLSDIYNKPLGLKKDARIAIIGLGNTACDVAEVLKDYSTTLYYRRTIAESRAHKNRIETIKEYTNIIEKYQPVEEELKDFDLVIECLGTEKPQHNIYKEFDNYIMLNENTYVGGDEAYGSDTVNRAIQSGIDIAKDIIKRLGDNNNE